MAVLSRDGTMEWKLQVSRILGAGAVARQRLDHGVEGEEGEVQGLVRR